MHSRGGAHLSPRRLLSSPCALRPALRAFPLSFRVCCEYPCILGRLAPCAYCVCVPCHTCRAFSFVFLLFRPRAHCAPLRVPSHRARVLPSVQFICVPTAYVSARAPIRTVVHIPSPLPLSRDANPLVTCACRVQLGCSGHPHPHIPHSHPPRRELLTI